MRNSVHRGLELHPSVPFGRPTRIDVLENDVEIEVYGVVRKVCSERRCNIDGLAC
jgi:hypothetical protein